MRMRVTHDYQKKSALRWVNCRAKLNDSNERRQHWNAKLNEEVEDVENDDEEDMYFEIESSPVSSVNLTLHVNRYLIIFLVSILNANILGMT